MVCGGTPVVCTWSLAQIVTDMTSINAALPVAITIGATIYLAAVLFKRFRA